MKAVVKKQQTVDALVESFKGATAVYLLNFQGITVDKDNALRKALAAKGVKYHAVKNTLLKRVLEALKVEGLNDSLTGATSVMVGFEEDPLLPAREIEAFHKANPDFLVAKSIYLDGKAMPGSEVVNLSKIPDRKGMIAMIVSIALGPGSTIAGQLKTLQEKLEKESGSETKNFKRNNRRNTSWQLISRHWAIKLLVLPFSKLRLWLTILKKPTASKPLPVAL
ncbi:50S ribosomal protein L10 [Fibrobacter succinogenes]|uniref:50S ribosomal protein L10 n=1 Tax=Fibrobacter succinogenes TaxID=833 RepID=UPI0026E94E2C|nr:50S ribosomal protein L10 [Fibrobacter succinogenes]